MLLHLVIYVKFYQINVTTIIIIYQVSFYVFVWILFLIYLHIHFEQMLCNKFILLLRYRFKISFSTCFRYMYPGSLHEVRCMKFTNGTWSLRIHLDSEQLRQALQSSITSKQYGRFYYWFSLQSLYFYFTQ